MSTTDFRLSTDKGERIIFVNTLRRLAVVDSPYRNYRHRSVAAKICQDARLAPIQYSCQNYFPTVDLTSV